MQAGTLDALTLRPAWARWGQRPGWGPPPLPALAPLPSAGLFEGACFLGSRPACWCMAGWQHPAAAGQPLCCPSRLFPAAALWQPLPSTAAVPPAPSGPLPQRCGAAAGRHCGLSGSYVWLSLQARHTHGRCRTQRRRRRHPRAVRRRLAPARGSTCRPRPLPTCIQLVDMHTRACLFRALPVAAARTPTVPSLLPRAAVLGSHAATSSVSHSASGTCRSAPLLALRAACSAAVLGAPAGPLPVLPRSPQAQFACGLVPPPPPHHRRCRRATATEPPQPPLADCPLPHLAAAGLCPSPHRILACPPAPPNRRPAHWFTRSAAAMRSQDDLVNHLKRSGVVKHAEGGSACWLG